VLSKQTDEGQSGASHKLPTPNVSTGHRPSAILRQTSSANRTHFSESIFHFWIERYPKWRNNPKPGGTRKSAAAFKRIEELNSIRRSSNTIHQ
jgi:hypothetical protein